MAGISNYDQLFLNGAIEGFTDLIAPLTAFSYGIEQQGASLNDKVKVAYVTNASGSSQFNYTTGYTGTSNGVTGKDVTLNSLLFQPFNLSDADMAKMAPEVITRLGNQAGKRLASDVISASFAAVVSAANFPLSSSNAAYSASAFSSNAALADLDLQANTQKWQDGERYVIAGTTLWSALMNNTSVTNAYAFGGSEAIRNGKIPSIYGFVPYKTTVTLPNSDTGFAVQPNAILLAMAYHEPKGDASTVVTGAKLKDETSGLTIGYRSWYDANTATTKKVIDCLTGVAVGNPNALIHIK